MTATTTRLDPQRVERLSAAALGLQSLAALLALLLAGLTSGRGLWLVAAQAGIGALFWVAVLIHLKLRRGARCEASDRQRIEAERASRGLESIFEDDEGAAQRAWVSWSRRLAPLFSLLLTLLCAAPILALTLAVEGGLAGLWRAEAAPAYPLVSAVFLLLLGFGTLSLGMYMGGLSRVPRWSVLRAGAGVMLLSTGLFGLEAVALGLSAKGALWAEGFVALLALAALTLQAVEMGLNLLLDIYRPRVAGVEARPGFDSRLTGWLAEPQNITESIAHTLDYQFGFKVSETWFYRFLERSFAALVLIQLTSFYALSAFVVVQPGERVIIERFGAPRGVAGLPAADAAWDELAPPLGPGVHLKWPWPLEVARSIDAEKVTTLHIGYAAADEASSKDKARSLNARIVTWDEQHVSDETNYILPLPASASPEDAEGARLDVMMLRLFATVEYKVGSLRSGDVYRFAYLHRDPEASIRALVEREVTAFLAGARFWDLMVERPEELQAEALASLRAAAKAERLGIEVVSFQIEEVHPPAGSVGLAYQDILSARELKQSAIYEAEAAANRIQRGVPARTHRVLAEARSRAKGQRAVAEARADRFASQRELDALAPDVFRQRTLLDFLEAGLGGSRKFIVPKEMELRFDRSQLIDPLGDAIERSLEGE